MKKIFKSWHNQNLKYFIPKRYDLDRDVFWKEGGYQQHWVYSDSTQSPMIDDVPCSLGLSIARQNWTQKILIATTSWKFLQKHISLDSFLHQNLIFYFTRSRNSHTVAIKNTIPRLYDFFDNLSFAFWESQLSNAHFMLLRSLFEKSNIPCKLHQKNQNFKGPADVIIFSRLLWSSAGRF